MKRLALAAALAFSACSSGSPIIPAGFDGPVAVVAFKGINPDSPSEGIVSLLAVASFRGDELVLVDPLDESPVPGPNLAWALSIPTLPRPTFLAAASLGDDLADLLVVAGAQPKVQIVGTWLDGADGGYATTGFGVVETIDLSGVVGPGAQILSMVAASVPEGPPTGTPPVAPAAKGRAWIVIGLTDVDAPRGGQLVVLEVARQVDGSIALAAAPVVKPLGFPPIAMAAAPDNVHVYLASQQPIQDSSGQEVLGIAEVDVSGGLGLPWPVRGFDARGAPTFSVAAAFVGERTQENFYTFAPPALRVYASLDPSGCGPEARIACGVATFDPALGGLAANPAVPGPPGWRVPTQSYRTPLFVAALPIAMGIAPPPANPGPNPPSTPFGSQVCYSPAQTGVALPLCPSITEVASNPPFNNGGAPQSFMLQAPPTGQLWTSVTGLVTAIDGLAYLQDLGRFGPVNAVSMLNDDGTRTKPLAASPVGPLGPIGNSSLFGFPDGTTALGLWLDQGSGTKLGTVVSDATDLASAITVWPGFTKDDHWLVSYQGVLPGLAQRRAVLGLSDDATLYLAIQEAAVPSNDGVLPDTSYWVPGAIVARPDLGIHTDGEGRGSRGHRRVPARQRPLRLDATKLDPDRQHGPGLRSHQGAPGPRGEPPLAPPGERAALPGRSHAPRPGRRTVADPALAAEYQCLVAWFQRPENAGKVLTAFRNNPPSTDYARGAWIRAGGLAALRIGGGLRGQALHGPSVRARLDRRDRAHRRGARAGPEGAPVLLPVRIPEPCLPGIPGHGRPDAARAGPGIPRGALLPRPPSPAATRRRRCRRGTPGSTSSPKVDCWRCPATPTARREGRP